VAERVGFEPPEEKPHNGFRVLRFSCRSHDAVAQFLASETGLVLQPKAKPTHAGPFTAMVKGMH
jgi:hypothetical protein